MNNLPVLIVGAGPTGLLMACELARRGISFRIIDKKPERTLTSNATVIQTRTIELFDEMGLSDSFLKKGHRCKAMNIYTEGKLLVQLPFNHTQNKSLYPFVLTLAQSKTEKILIDYLDKFELHVERPVELLDLEQEINKNMINVTLRSADNKIENLQCDWLIACDGANSTVREKCQAYFPGKDLTEQFVVADAHMDSFLHIDEIQVFLAKGTLLAVFPMGSHKYRIGANLYLGYPRKFYTEKEVKEIVIERACGNYNVQSVSWISPFWIHSKLINKLRYSSVFFAGDAAHIHSPAGGQGMNIGLQDAYNLAWKLALVIQGKANSSLLDSYQAERYPIVAGIVKRTEQFTKIAISDNYLMLMFRNFIGQILQRQESLLRRISMKISEVSVAYRQSPVIDYHECAFKGSPKPGEHAPNLILDKDTTFLNYFRNLCHNVLLFTGDMPTKQEWIEIKELIDWFVATYPDVVQVSIVSPTPLPSLQNVILDKDFKIHHYYQIQKPAIYIIRPDDYIAYCSKRLEVKPIERFLKRYLQ